MAIMLPCLGASVIIEHKPASKDAGSEVVAPYGVLEHHLFPKLESRVDNFPLTAMQR